MNYLKIFTDFRDAIAPLTSEEAGNLFRAMLLYAENGTEPELTGNERYLWIVARQHIDREAEAYETKKKSLRENGKKGAAARWDRSEQKDGKCHCAHGKEGQDNDNENDKYNEKEEDNDISFLSGPALAPEEPAAERMAKNVGTPAAEKKETYPPFGWIDSVLEPEKTEKREMSDPGDGEKKEDHPSQEEVEAYIRKAYLPVDAEHFYNYYQANGWMMGSQPMRDWKAALKAWARNAPVRPRPANREPSYRDNFIAVMEMARQEEAKLVN